MKIQIKIQNIVVLLLFIVVPLLSFSQKGVNMANPIDLGIYTSDQPEGFLDEFRVEDYGNFYGNAAEEVFFKFTVTGNTDITISLGNITTNHVYILNESGVLVQSHAYTSEWYPLEMTIASGTYFLVIEGGGTNMPGGTLVIDAVFQVKDNSGVSLPIQGKTLATAIDMGVFISGEFQYEDRNSLASVFGWGDNYGNSNDDIFYKFRVDSRSGIEISLCESNFMTDVYLLNSSGGLIVANNGDLCSTNSSIQHVVDPGTYYIVVEGSGTLFGTLKLNVKGHTVASEGTNMSNAILIGNYQRAGILYAYHDIRSNQPEYGHGNQMGQPSDEIYYKLILDKTTNLNISLCGSDFDTYLYILSNSGSTLYSNNDNGPSCSGTASSLQVAALPAGSYYIVVEGNGSASGTSNLMVTALLSGSNSTISFQAVSPNSNQNYIVTKSLVIDGVTSAGILSSVVPQNIRAEVQYFDGLGRLSQQIKVQASPDGKDIIIPTAYDSFGRETRAYLPYAATTNSSIKPGSYRNDAILSSYTSSAQYQFYQIDATSIPKMANPFTETVYEPSPLSKITEIAHPGKSWALGFHTQKSKYEVNLAGEVRNWSVTLSGGNPIGATTGSAFYPKGSLRKTTSWDENGYAKISFEDKEGRLISSRVQDGGTASAPTYQITDYVYDSFGHLIYVIPPALSTISTFSESDANFINYIYAYHYDGLSRMIEKKIPGSGWEYTVFNTADLPVYVQTASQRDRAGGSVWSFVKYDRLGRVIMTGEYKSSATRASLQSTINSTMKPTGTLDWFENVNLSLTYGYSTSSYPNHSGSDVQVLTVKYYDNYRFLSAPAVVTAAVSSRFRAPDGSNNEITQTSGLVTGALTRVLGTNDFLLDETFYDHRYRTSKVISGHLLNGVDEVTNTYNFVGELLTSQRLHFKDHVSALTINQSFSYDHSGRQISASEQINSQTPSVINFDYNALGQLEVNSAGGQSVVQRYNSRGWIQKLSTPLFNLSLAYDAPFGSLDRQYTGNIARQEWFGGDSPELRQYNYTYDAADRLLTGHMLDGVGESLTYDKMGNILSLVRTGVSSIPGSIGSFTYSYGSNGNRLQSFGNGSSYVRNYIYDNEGRVTSDGVRNIAYNEVNLPKEIRDAANSLKVSYIYDAAGRKLRKATSVETRNYIRGIEYLGVGSSAAIDFIHTQSGIARRSGSTYVHEYILRDHLGNARVIHNGSGTVLQEMDYHPFGLEIARKVTAPKLEYTYNGKEWQAEVGQFDYGARLYDPVVGRWNVVDPLSESYAFSSPYGYVENNPILYLDPNGMYKVDYQGNLVLSDSEEIQSFFKFLNQNKGASINEMSNHIISAGQGFSWELDAVTVTGRSSFESGGWLGDIKGQVNDAVGLMGNINSIATSTFGFDRTKSALDYAGGFYRALGTAVAPGSQWLGKNGKYYNSSWGGNQYTGSRSEAYKAAGMYKWAGRGTVFTSVLVSGLETYRGYQIDGGQLGYNAQRAAASGVGGVMGGYVGAKSGAYVGATIGLFFGGVGAVPGALIGGFIGGLAGGYAGSNIGSGAVNFYHGR